jgi:hypothetical protein
MIYQAFMYSKPKSSPFAPLPQPPPHPTPPPINDHLPPPSHPPPPQAFMYSKPEYINFAATARTIYAEGGVLNFWRGLLPRMTRIIGG